MTMLNELNNAAAATRRVGKQGAVVSLIAASRVLTLKGQRPAVALEAGDQVMTRNNGLQTIRFVARRDAETAQMVHIKAGSLGEALPESDLVVAATDMVKMADAEDMIAAADLVGRDGITALEADVAIVEIMFDDCVTLLVEGVWVDAAAVAKEDTAEELTEKFPGLKLSAAPFKADRTALNPAVEKLLSDVIDSLSVDADA
ncbi:Hint domain-containing protein [Pseudooceanicola sp. MF1-13]|uniref:Hint domain-containing protein n=1 Tax=Pseudooceanicola sp. MF1-13 TaxID=3379095 RepID=UPI0038912AE5